MAAPEYVICVECETPCYVFEWQDSVLVEAVCLVCGNDEVDHFATPDDFDSLAGGDRD